ncbi:hypothetical protein CXQ85_005239 [Candidozyma haemuli]|uniref:Uncharacterized protein n=1 Tax=Candidozyma haemuli TaxID=45357 RepID=A0A2V1AXU3_9ASCO|nr:hypothetical protein CXQ85_005239 [[Candida] haemuloni]PVH22665.1 hypothetical protein CXQ85_005239 [[Candida] haemuloni]
MVLLKPGLPAKTLREIRATNTISARLLEQLQKLNEETAVFLQTASVPSEPTEIQHIFQDFYFLVGANTSSKNLRFPEIRLAKLRQVARSLDKVVPQNEIDSALVNIIDRYLVVLGAHELANSFIFKTIVLTNQGIYWSDVKSSNYGKLCFGVQTLPSRVYDFACRGVHNATFVQLNNQGIYQRFKNALQALWDSFSRAGAQVYGHLNKNFVLRGSRLRFLTVPLSFIDAEIKEKVDAVQAQLDVHYGQLGLFINSLPVDIELLGKLLDCDANRSTVLQKIEDKMNDDSEYKNTRAPGFISRYWPVLALLVKYGPSTSVSIYQNRLAIVDWVRHNLVDTVVGFWKNWVVKPIWDMLGILRADDQMTITSKESLQSDLNSLERMVTDFMKDNNMTVDANQTKVDGAIAIGGIDKLLKSQQLLFGMLSVSPSLFILYQANQALHSDGTFSKKSQRITCLKSLNRVGALVNREVHEDKLVGDGKLFVEMVNLTLLSKSLIPKRLSEDWLKDLNSLMVASAEDSESASRAVERIWNMYSPFFRRGV